MPRLQLRQQGVLQGVEALSIFRAQGQHRLCECLAQQWGVDMDPEAGRFVRHVEGQHRGQAQLLHLQRQPQLPVELAGVEHHQHQIHGVRSRKRRTTASSSLWPRRS